jgi:diphosphomevalonate decarboxylase
LHKNLKGMGPDLEIEAVELHMLAMTSRPPIFYWAPGTVRVMDAVRIWREQGLSAYYTLDAGANVHILVEAANADEVAKRVRELEQVKDVLNSAPGGGAILTENHLF